MPAQHPLVTTEFFGVTSRSAKDFAPPHRHMTAVVLVNSSWEERREQFVLLSAVTEFPI